MTEKRFINDIDIGQLVDTKGELSTIDYSDTVDFYELWEFLNKLSDENEQLKQDKFICLDCKYSGYTEIGCLCEKKDHWTDYKTECEDYEELFE